MCLRLGQNSDELVEIIDTPAKKNLHQLVMDVTWLYDVEQVLSLQPRDAPSCSELSEKHVVRVKQIKQMNTIHIHRASLSLIQRSVVTAVY